MKLLSEIFSRLYKYITVFIVVGSPLFFIPNTVFTTDTTYYITIIILIAIALLSYCISSSINKSWHSVSKLEYISYFGFSVAVILSSLFSRDAQRSFFGEDMFPMTGAALLSLPVIMYLVRNLPEKIRKNLKYVLATILGLASFIFVMSLIFSGKLTLIANSLFSGFPNIASFSAYMSLFVVACLFFVRKAMVSTKYKVVIVTTAILFASWVISFTSQDAVRPDLLSTLTVGKSVLMNDGPFGIGPDNFNRAWQLYRPEKVVSSPYFSYEFSQGSDTMSTLLVTIGIFGLIAFLTLVLSSIYGTYKSYKSKDVGHDHFVLGLITISLFYFACVAWVVPLSYSMLVTWMVISGLGVAKINLNERHPNKSLALLMIPVTLLLIVNAYILLQKVQAFSILNRAQKSSSVENSISLIKKASSIYAYDGFSRAEVEYVVEYDKNLIATTTLSKEDLIKYYTEKTQSAIEAGRTAVKINPDNYQNYVSLGRAYELALPINKDSEFDNAKKSYEQAAKLFPENPYIYLMLARLEASAGTKEGMRAQLTEALKKNQNFADALYLMSQLEASDKNIEEALKYAVETVKNAPNDPLAHTQAGLLFYAKKDYQNSVNELQTALKEDPNNVNVAYFLSLVLRDGGRPDIAKTIVDQLVKIIPGNKDLLDLSKSLSAQISASQNSTKTVIKK